MRLPFPYTQVNGGSSATVDTINGEPLTASPAGGDALLFRGRQSAATTVRTDLKTCNSVVDFINQVRWASSRPRHVRACASVAEGPGRLCIYLAQYIRLVIQMAPMCGCRY